jgi:hypothetical protein
VCSSCFQQTWWLNLTNDSYRAVVVCDINCSDSRSSVSCSLNVTGWRLIFNIMTPCICDQTSVNNLFCYIYYYYDILTKSSIKKQEIRNPINDTVPSQHVTMETSRIVLPSTTPILSTVVMLVMSSGAKRCSISWHTRMKVGESMWILILPWVCPQDSIGWFGIVYV